MCLLTKINKYLLSLLYKICYINILKELHLSSKQQQMQIYKIYESKIFLIMCSYHSPVLFSSSFLIITNSKKYPPNICLTHNNQLTLQLSPTHRTKIREERKQLKEDVDLLFIHLIHMISRLCKGNLQTQFIQIQQYKLDAPTTPI